MNHISKGLDLALLQRQKRQETFIVTILGAFAGISIITTFLIIAVLLTESVDFFTDVSFLEFFTSIQWTPLIEPRKFGVLPIVYGTLFVAVGACLFSVPIGISIAIYLSEYASSTFRSFAKPVLEILAGIPSIVFGYFALTSITPLLQMFLPSTHVFNALSAAIVVGIMTLPMMASLSDDAFQAIPRSLKDAGYALGATKYEIIKAILVPSAISGIIAAFILAFSRAIGETMAVTLAAGSTPKLTLNPLESIQTMTAYIVQVSLGDTPHGTIEYRSIFVVGFLLFFITLTMNMLSRYVLKRLRKITL